LLAAFIKTKQSYSLRAN